MAHNPNLHPKASKYLSKTDEDRIAFIRRDVWIEYPIANKMLNKMESIFKSEEKVRMRGMLIHGNSNNGKTAILKRFCKQHDAGEYEDADGNTINMMPTVYTIAPPCPDESRMYVSILSSMNVPFSYADSTAKKLSLVEYYIKILRIKVIVIDEIHNVLSGSYNKRTQFMEALKNLTIDKDLKIFLAGTNDALSAVSIDNQMKSRFQPHELPNWHNDDLFASFIHTLETMIPLKNASNLYSDKRFLAKLHDKSTGCIGEAINIIKDAAVEAIISGSEKITQKEVADSMW